MKHIKNKKFLLSGSALLVAIVALGATIAYSHDSSIYTNEFNLANYQIAAIEDFASPTNWKPCGETPKTFVVKNESEAPVMVRVKYEEAWRNKSDTQDLPLRKDGVTLVNVVLQNLDDWSLKVDGYYYYNFPLAPNSITSSLFEKVVLNCDANFGADNVCIKDITGTVCAKPDDEYEGASYHLRLIGETIQANAVDEWNIAYLDTGKNTNSALKSLAAGSTKPYSSTDSTIKSIAIVDELPDTVNPAVTDRVLISPQDAVPVYAYDDGDHNIYIHTEADKIYANADSSYLFYEMANLATITLSESFDTSSVTNMEQMFCSARALTSLILPESFDTSSVTNMRAMFSATNALTSLVLPESFDSSSVTDMNSMFAGTYALSSLELPEKFDTSSVTNMRAMFYISSLTSLTFPESFDTSSVTDMSDMFRNMNFLTSLTLPERFNTSSVTDMNHMFANMPALTSLVFPESFDTSSVKNMRRMFYETNAIAILSFPDSFNTNSATDLREMFFGASALTTLTLPTGFVARAGTNPGQMFIGVPATATLNANADASVRSLWPGQFRD